MSMEHKAFIFDTKKYHEDIEPILDRCCQTNSTNEVEAYISQHLSEFTSPYTGDELDEGWLDELENGDVQEYADFLLTACYDCNKDIGLEYTWEGVIEIIKFFNITSDPEVYVLGHELKYHNTVIDPGAMGLGIVEADEVGTVKEILNLKRSQMIEFDESQLPEDLLYDVDVEELIDAYEDLCSIYTAAFKAQKGLMFTF